MISDDQREALECQRLTIFRQVGEHLRRTEDLAKSDEGGEREEGGRAGWAVAKTVIRSNRDRRLEAACQ